MNMSEKNIPYKSIIMRCDCINKNAFAEVTERYSIVKYHSEMKSVWVEIQKAAGQFADYGCIKAIYTKYENQAIYLHTQPSSFQAIKLYNDFGFHITKEDSYGHAVNEYTEAMEILEKVMNADAYMRLKNTVKM